MTTYITTLKILAIGIFAVSSIHIIFGVSSELILGSAISPSSQGDPNLDSQNRFYGASFALFGVVFWLASTNLTRYATLLKLAYVVFALAGVARVISIAVVGWPTLEILILTAIEIFGPPVMYLWLNRVLSNQPADA